DWRMAVVAVIVFFAVLFIWKYMSLASCTASFFCPVALLVIGPTSIWVEILCILSAALVIVRHKENLIKLAHGTESKFSLFNK
ncbi:MAG: glycerol-3-phosphate acyltransferase, partial [Lachnospiraceae bacterium]|nr:glycerol-3-phosphate acyltransferase [Lachnospiraceae bacterium]